MSEVAERESAGKIFSGSQKVARQARQEKASLQGDLASQEREDLAEERRKLIEAYNAAPGLPQEFKKLSFEPNERIFEDNQEKEKNFECLKEIFEKQASGQRVPIEDIYRLEKVKEGLVSFVVSNHSRKEKLEKFWKEFFSSFPSYLFPWLEKMKRGVLGEAGVALLLREGLNEDIFLPPAHEDIFNQIDLIGVPFRGKPIFIQVKNKRVALPANPQKRSQVIKEILEKLVQFPQAYSSGRSHKAIENKFYAGLGRFKKTFGISGEGVIINLPGRGQDEITGELSAGLKEEILKRLRKNLVFLKD